MSDELVKENVSLAPYTTFRIGGPARYFIEVSDMPQIAPAVAYAREKNVPLLLVGGGSNLLVSDTGFAGCALHIASKGIKVSQENGEVRLNVQSGEIWDRVVEFAVLHGWWGLENLSHIPGLTGGIPIQNVGAYGQEASQVITAVETYDIETDTWRHFDNSDCHFQYRRSVFNTTAAGRYIVTNVEFRLTTAARPILTYRDVADYFTDRPEPTLTEIRQAIIEIRDRKLPHPNVTGSAGSFFKNLTLSDSEYKQLTERISGQYDSGFVTEFKEAVKERDGMYKVPAAFIIDRVLGCKGLASGGARIHDRQALVIVNHTGRASARDVMELFRKVRRMAYERLGIALVPEPNLIGFSQAELDHYFSLTDE